MRSAVSVALPYPSSFKYTAKHAWVECASPYAKVGVTHYGQHQVGDVVHIDFPRVGASLDEGQWFGTIESTDAVLELYSPISGEVVQVNGLLRKRPEAVNADPHGNWIIMIKIKLREWSDSADLMDAQQYARHVGALCEQW
jgi:glycine cleavage system H protein